MSGKTKVETTNPRSIGLSLGDMLWGNVGTANRLDFTAMARPSIWSAGSKAVPPARPQRAGQRRGCSGDETALVPLGEHILRGIAAPCAVFTLPEE